MSVIDWILNLACVLLWLSWRSIRLSDLPESSVLSLVSTLKRTEPARPLRWSYLLALAVILFSRGLFYHQIGSATSWTPTLELSAVSLPFRSDRLLRILLYSLLSFGVWLGALYAWALVLSAINHHVSDTDPGQRFIRLHLGWIERWPVVLKLFLLPFLAALFWISLHPILVRVGIIAPSASVWRILGQALTIGAASLLLWKPILLAVFALHIVNSYVYLGTLPLWNFASVTANNLLQPLKSFPLRIGRIDLSPFLAIALVLGLSAGISFFLPKAFQFF